VSATPTGSPLISVILCTFNRADVVGRTLDAVLAQEGPTFEAVVVDDGSTDTTPELLAAIDDPRLRVVRQANSGLSVARNTGLTAAHGTWVVFLDDDDVPDQGWLAALTRPTDDPGVGITCCGARAVDPDGNEICELPIIHLPAPFGGVLGAYRAGTFAVRTDLCRQAGGYLNGLGTSHQFELFMRLQEEAERQGLRVEATDANVISIERRPVDDRRSSNPHIIYDATSWILERHPERFAAAVERVAAFEGVRGHAAARMGDWPTARRHFWASARMESKRRVNWGRLALALVPPLGGWAWNRHSNLTYDPSTVGVLVQVEGNDNPERELFLAWGYKENPPPDAPTGEPTAVAPEVRRLASRLTRRVDRLVVQVAEDVQQDEDPVGLLQRIARDAVKAPILLSVVDRVLTDPDRPLGPPSDPGHRREWTFDQFRLLLRSTGFRIERMWRRGPHMVFLIRASDTPPTRIN
jgi:glycosyltransferase involved in cell wall biosynthesis